MLMFGIIDFGRLFFAQMTIQHALRQAGRFGVTGNHVPDPKNPAQNLTRVDSIKQVATDAAAGLDVKNIQISSLQGGTNSAGGPSDTLLISLTTDLKLFTPFVGRLFNTSGVYTFKAATTFKNEPFDPSQTN